MQKKSLAAAAVAFLVTLPSLTHAQPPGSPNEAPEPSPPKKQTSTETAPAAEPNTPAVEPEPEQEAANTAGILRASRQGLGMEPGALNFGDLILPPPPGSQVTPGTLKANQLNFHGYMRAPMLIGWGQGGGADAATPKGTKLHAPPQVPDAAYTDWQYTNNLGGPWTELQFVYGNAKVFGNVQLASYNLSDASYKDLIAQLGINQAWLTINLPDLFGDRGGLRWNIGGFSAGYGRAGRYDAGQYGTYLFGRTHTTGETVSMFYDVLDDLTLQFEHGIGGRIRPFPDDENTPMAQFLPYAGPKRQHPTFLHHAHLGVTYLEKFTFALHYMNSFSKASEQGNLPDGDMRTFGAELRMIDTQWGWGWLGVSHLTAKNAIHLAGALEVLHSSEGWSLIENFFGEPRDLVTQPGQLFHNDGNGSITSVAWEYTFSLATFLRHPEPFWGQGPDLLVSLFGMYNQVSSPDPTFATAKLPTAKLKLGGEITYTPKYFLGMGLRTDLVQPDMNDSRKSFTVLSPRLLFRTDFISNEQIIVQYTRYFNGSNVQLAFPYDEGKYTADTNVFSIIATMWW